MKFKYIESLTNFQIFLAYWGMYFCWEWGRDLVNYFGLDTENELYVTAGCITVMRIYSTILCEMPFTIYGTFVLEEKHKFNKQTARFFIKDQIIKFIVSHVTIILIFFS